MKFNYELQVMDVYEWRPILRGRSKTFLQIFIDYDTRGMHLWEKKEKYRIVKVRDDKPQYTFLKLKK